MPQGTISVYLFLLSCINGKHLTDTGIALAWPGYPTIADETGIRNHNSIRNIIGKLIKLGYVSKEKGYPPIKSNEGTILAPSKKDVQKCWLYTLKSGLEGKDFSHAEMEIYMDQKKYNRTIPEEIANDIQKAKNNPKKSSGLGWGG